MISVIPGWRRFAHVLLAVGCLTGLAACGGGGGGGSPATAPATGSGGTTPPGTTTTTYTIGGSVSGLASGQSVVLAQGSDQLTVSADGNFTMPAAVAALGSYAVSITAQPTGQACGISNASGSVLQANVTNVQVVCSTFTYSISGTVSGLPTNTQVVLQDNGGDAVTLAADGAFTFLTKIPYNGSYAVTVGTQPVSGSCTVSANGSNSGITADVTNVVVTCSDTTFTVSGTLTGLAASTSVVLQNNNADNLTLSSSGPFTFATPIAYDGSYNVTVLTQPTGQVCTVNNPTHASVKANVTGIQVTCSAQPVTVGVTVSGIASGVQVTLQNNGADDLVANTNGPFTFATPIGYGSAYAVTVHAQPTNQTCLVTNGTGTASGNVTNIGVSCETTAFTAAGSYTWTVPDGVTSINVVATGGGGGGGGAGAANTTGGAGGSGAVVTSTVTVTPGTTINLVVGGHGGAGTTGTGGAYGAGGGGGGASTFDAGAADQVIAGGGGGGGSTNNATAGGNGGGAGGAGNAGGNNGSSVTGGSGGAAGTGGAGGVDSFFASNGAGGGSGNGGAGGAGGDNGSSIPGGTAGSGSGAGVGGGGASVSSSGGGGGGYGGGGSGVDATGGGAGGSTGPSSTTYAPGANGGAAAADGTDGSIVITYN